MSDIDESTPLIKSKKEKKSILEVKNSEPKPKDTVNKKQRTIKQLEAFERARVKRLENLSKQKDEKLQELGKQYLESKKQCRLQSEECESDSEDEANSYTQEVNASACSAIPLAVGERKGRGLRGASHHLDEMQETSSSEEEIIIKRKAKPKVKHNPAYSRDKVKKSRAAPLPKKKRRIVYISESSSESESESESEEEYKPKVVINRGRSKPSKQAKYVGDNTYDFFV